MFGQLKVSFFFNLFLEVIPVFSGSRGAGQCFNYVNHQKPPFVFVNDFSDFFFLENGNLCGDFSGNMIMR